MITHSSKIAQQPACRVINRRPRYIPTDAIIGREPVPGGWIIVNHVKKWWSYRRSKWSLSDRWPASQHLHSICDLPGQYLPMRGLWALVPVDVMEKVIFLQERMKWWLLGRWVWSFANPRKHATQHALMKGKTWLVVRIDHNSRPPRREFRSSFWIQISTRTAGLPATRIIRNIPWLSRTEPLSTYVG